MNLIVDANNYIKWLEHKLLTDQDKWVSVQPKTYDIDFGGALMVRMTVNNNIPIAEMAINGYGESVDITTFIATEITTP